jgi:hypothetical protein
MHTESPLLQILLTQWEAKRLVDALPPGEEQRKLRNKIAACDVAIDFLKANSESARQNLGQIPMMAAHSPRSQQHMV